jgi:hypothetical protein
MACDYNNLCGPSNADNKYVKNGGSAYQGFSFEDNHVYMPYVEVVIGLNGKDPDVYLSGDAQSNSFKNDSGCDNEQESINVATSKSYIQSFEMTVGRSFTGSIVIVTCDYKVVNKLLNTTPPKSCEWDEYTLGGGIVQGHIDIGWIIKGCNGTIYKYTMKDCCENNIYEDEDGGDITSGPYIYGTFKKVDVTAENGVYKVTMNFVDGGPFNEESKLDRVWGSEPMLMSFKDAMQYAAAFRCDTRKDDGKQKVTRIKFLSRNNIFSMPEPWKFKNSEGGKKGILSVWNSNRESLFDYFREISLFFRTVSEKGWWFAYDNGVCGFPMILLVEDRDANICVGEEGIQSNSSLITYIINGGDCSPVIKFNPSFNSVPLQDDKQKGEVGHNNIGVGAVGPSALNQQPIQISDCIKVNGLVKKNPNDSNSASGLLASPIPPAELLNSTPPSLIPTRGVDGVYAQAKAEAQDGNAMNLFAPVKATLEIHGDPFWANTFNFLNNCFIRIIFINTYCITNKGNGEGCEFLQDPKCNNRFTGIYKVGSAKHLINAGSYVTSLELFAITSDAVGGSGGVPDGMPM